MNDCSGFGTPNCFDDPRATVVNEDAVSWFRSKFGSNACKSVGVSKFDVIIIDLLDPEELKDFEWGKFLYSEEFFKELSCAINDDGVVIAQLGEAPGVVYPDKDYVFKDDLLKMVAGVFNRQPFVYDMYVPSFMGEWSYMAVFKNAASESRWMGSSAFVNLAIRQRLHQAAIPLKYYDGSVHRALQKIPKQWETLYCFNDPHSVSCRWRDSPSIHDGKWEWGANEQEPFLTTKSSSIRGDGIQTVATQDLEENQRIGLWDAASTLKISRSDLEGLKALNDNTHSADYTKLYNILMKYGYFCDGAGEGQMFYMSLLSLHTFNNDACDDKDINVDGQLSNNKDEWDDDGDDDEYYGWDPVIVRYAEEHCADTRMRTGVKAGQPLLESYGTFGTHNEVHHRAWCGE